LRKALLILASAITVVIIIVVALFFLRLWRLPFLQVEILGITHSSVHWMGWIGAIYIAIATPVYPIIKRKYPRHLNKSLNVHVVGNLLGILFISIHFAQQVTRPASNYPNLGTGIVLYATMFLLWASGMVMVSGIDRKFSKQIRFLHPAYAITFYTVIVMHIIQDLIVMPPFT
jgi:hypothetical protein